MAPFDLTGPYDIHRNGVPEVTAPPSSAPSPLAIMTNHLLIDLAEQRDGLIAYLLGKVKFNDWHACADACMDLREVEAQIALLKELRG